MAQRVSAALSRPRIEELVDGLAADRGRELCSRAQDPPLWPLSRTDGSRRISLCLGGA